MTETLDTNQAGTRGKLLSERSRVGYVFYIIGALLSFAILISRRPEMLLNPQFWAEDGRIWYADAYNHGIHFSLFTPDNGYFQTLPRLTAVLGQAIPLHDGPVFFLLVALAIQVVTALFIISPRMSGIIADLRARILLAFIYLALPHSWEVFANLTNSQWHIALLAMLILVAKPGSGWVSLSFDYVIFAILALTGPFCLLLLPIGAVQLFRRRDAHTVTLLAILSLGAVVQGISLLSVGRTLRPQLEASVELFFRIIGRNIFAGAVLGSNGFDALQRRSFWRLSVVVLFNLAGFAALGLALYRSKPEVRLMILFSSLICLTALVLPAVTELPGQWQVMATYDTATRYWFIPIFTSFAVLIYFAFSKEFRVLQKAAIAILLFSSVGLVFDWKLPPLKDLDFPRHAAAFENAPSGSEVVIPINPDWEMKLVKK
jgi:lipoprotein signal peptidase